MFCRFLIRSSKYTKRINLFNTYKPQKQLKCEISNKNTKNNPHGNNGKNRSFRNRNTKNENESSKIKNDSKPEGFQEFNFNFLGMGIALFIFGSSRIYIELKRILNNPQLTYAEFENKYLLRGEVRKIQRVGPIVRNFTGCIAEVLLYPDQNRNHQTVAIYDSLTDINIHQSIRNIEENLGIQRHEAVIFDTSKSEEFAFLGLLLIGARFAKSIFRKSSFDKRTDFQNIMQKMQQEMRKPPPFPFDPKKAPPFPFDPKKAPPFPFDPKKFPSFPFDHRTKEKPFVEQNKKEKRPPDIVEMFTEFLTDVTTKQFDEKSDIKFKDVAGLHSAKQEVKEFLDYLNKPGKFIRLGARLPRGAMLLGPPGCGKTLLVKALANESNVPFYYKAGSEFVDMIGGIGAKRIRQLFSSARDNAPAIIFIDEIDAIGKKRSAHGAGGVDVDQTLNQLLVEMDGMDANLGVVVFAATNRADVLDGALIRPGRLDRHILIDLPVLEERKEIFNLYLNKYNNKLEDSVSNLTNKLALQTPGMSGADISNLCNEAALTAAKFNYKIIKNECFDMALERIIAGAAKKNNFLSSTERKIVAYHEAGHAIVGWFLKHADPILKVSIVPRTNAALGFTQINVKERYLLTTDILVDKITVLLGGRAAESIIFNRVTSGAHDDFQKVKKIAYSMIREWGMSDAVGHLSFNVSAEDDAYGILPYSMYTQSLIESEASRIITTAYKRAESLLQENISKLELLAEELLRKEVLVYNDIEKLIGPQPHPH